MHWFLFLLIFSNISLISSQQPLPLLLLVSLDGFRHDYWQLHGPLTNFQRLAQRGVRSHSMIPTFNTATIPNHYTLVTGVYEEVHGLISNEIYDPRTNEIFHSWNNASDDWWPLKSIWRINEERNDARSGVIGWPQNSIDASQVQTYKKDRPFREMIDQMLRWFNNPTESINFGALYFDQPASTGLQYGPYSAATKQVVHQCDQDLGYLLDEIDKNVKLRNNLYLIVTSSHGLEQVNATNQPIYLEDYVDTNKCQVFGTETVLNVFTQYSVTDLMKNLSRIPHSQTYRREEIPSHLHYKTHRHIGDLVVLVEPGFEIHRRTSYGTTRSIWNVTHGNAGYDNQLNSMKTIFYASGPHLKENFLLSSNFNLSNVDLFPLMCILLNIPRCPSSNGSLTNIEPFFTDPIRALNLTEREGEKLYDGPMGLVIYLLVLVSFVLMLIMAVVWSGVSFRNHSPMILNSGADPNSIAEQNQYKFTQINDQKLNAAIGNDNL